MVADLERARRVLALEAEALTRLCDSLDERFSTAVELLANAKGRIVVSGMGKSGHIATKIAATMASTGAPAMFVHPAEASHGDLGMITAEDALILLSNSGETAELADIIQFAKRRQIPLVALVGRAKSTLGDAATVALVMPDAPEACPLGLAPTTSTTMMLALGDALVVALLERRGFTAEDFQAFHPGGKLGRRLLRVGDIMHGGAAVPAISAGATMADALIVMTGKGFGCVGALDEAGRLVGIITDGDLRRHMGEGLIGRTVADVMTARPKFVRPSAFAAEALAVMNQRQITSLFVLEDDRPVGILHVHDCLRAGIT
ncbi:MAG: KpsF/GutQ family sugar-phosphate isomerase [Alphaproteobacteria bacterium]|nr:KpsF/GutQ family sugar-phosphate isomerase [Alphaproteobacteria bacterium]